ncbi:hypothetical protein ACK8HX_15915 [Oryzobacter sp. R7]|uniref:hypothetical protein n=1 Tax=Oryzobacter faecalis TaxID=3388656 RepID=UPI00398CCDFF
MSDQPEDLTDDLGSYSVDDEDQLQPEDTLEQGGPDDVLDEGYSPPERLHGSLAHGVTAEEQARDETIEERIHQEVPEEGTAYGAPDNESGLDEDVARVGGDDPDSIAAEDDWLGDEGEGAVDGAGSGTGGPAEEAAMHVVGDPEVGDVVDEE